MEYFPNDSFDAVFGPAYKGIPLAATTTATLFEQSGKSFPFYYNRKEAKSHGEGGKIVGSIQKGKSVRLLVLDDVITAGTAIRETSEILASEWKDARLAGVLVALDRQERISESEETSALQSVANTFGVKAHAIVNFNDLIEYLSAGGEDLRHHLTSMVSYRNKYGSK